MQPQASRPIRVSACALLFAAYFGALLPFLAARPFWLDEVLTLLGTRTASAAEVVRFAARNAGGAPLGYLSEWILMQCLPGPPWLARLLPAAFGAGSAVAVYVLGMRLGLRMPLLASALFFLTPLPFRYALEARPYSMALFFSLVATFLAARMASRRAAMGYFAANTIAIYTHPYAIFPALGHLLWASCWFDDRPATRRIAIALAASAACLLPWLAYAHDSWRLSAAGVGPVLSSTTVFSLIREFAGSGYPASIGLLSLAGIGSRSSALRMRVRLFLLAGIAMPVLAAIATDALFGYFFAIRQLLFVVPLVVMLAAQGLAAVPRRSLVASSALILFVIGDYRFLSGGKEDWEAAADALGQVSRHVDCIATPAAAMDIYAYFLPSLPIRTCSSNDRPEHLAYVIAPYFPHASRPPGYRLCAEREAGGTRIQLLLRNGRADPVCRQ